MFLLLAIFPAKIAENKGKDFWTWYVYGAWLWIFAMIHSLVVEEEYGVTQKQSLVGGESLKKCPYCSEFIKYSASVCRFCGSSLVNNNEQTESSSTTQIASSSSFDSSIKWKCIKCGCWTNSDNYNWCKSCNEPRYSMRSISESNKKIFLEYVEKQLALDDVEEIRKNQNSYFGSSSLEFLKFILPSIDDFKDINEFKTKLKEAIKEESVETKDVPQKVKSSESNVSISENTETSLERIGKI